MNNRRMVTLAGTVLLSTFSLVTSPGAQDASGTMMQHGNMTATSDKATDQMHNSMSGPAAVTSSETAKMKDAGRMHANNGHKMDAHMSQGKHNGMMGSGSTGEMSN